MLTCLQIVQAVCRRVGLLAPAYVMGNTENQVIQLLALTEEEGQEQATRYEWQSLQKEATFTTVAATTQTALSTIAPDFNYIINDTIWNRTLRRPVYGPKAAQDWQRMKATNISGPFNSFRIMADSILFYPNPTAGQSCAFEYISRNWVNTGVSTSSIWVNDADTPKLDDQLIVLGTVWRWKKAKGFDYSEDFNIYERRVLDAMGIDAGKPHLNMGDGFYDVMPTALISEGNWLV